MTDPSKEPDPYAALRRVLAMRPAEQRKLLRLVVACENNKCTPIRVFGLRDGALVQCRSDADVRDMQEQHPHLADWARRRAFFVDEWLRLEDQSETRLQVVCDCAQTSPRLVDVQKLCALIPNPEAKALRVMLPQITAPVM